MLVRVKTGSSVPVPNTRQCEILKSLENFKREIVYLAVAYMLKVPGRKNAQMKWWCLRSLVKGGYLNFSAISYFCVIIMWGISVFGCKFPTSWVCHSSPSSRVDRAWAGGPEFGLWVRRVSWSPYIPLTHIQPPWGAVEGGQVSKGGNANVKSKGGGSEGMEPRVGELDQCWRGLGRMTHILLGQKEQDDVLVEDQGQFLPSSPLLP